MLALKPPKAVWGGGTVSTTMTAWGVEAKRAFQLASKPVPLRSQAQWGWARCHPTFRGCFQNAVQQPEAGGDQTTEVREIDGELSSCKVRVSFKQKLVQKCVLSTTHVSSQPVKSTKWEKSNLYFFCQLKCEAKHRTLEISPSEITKSTDISLRPRPGCLALPSSSHEGVTTTYHILPETKTKHFSWLLSMQD